MLIGEMHFVFFSVRLTSIRTGAGGGPPAIGVGEAGFDTRGGLMEEYVLEDIELSPADLGE